MMLVRVYLRARPGKKSMRGITKNRQHIMHLMERSLDVHAVNKKVRAAALMVECVWIADGDGD
jgi:hypothetical protein